MNTFLNYLFVLALFGLITLPALVGHARERAIDRQLREAELREAEPLKAEPLKAEPRRAVRRSSTSAPVPSRATVRANSGSSSRPAPTTVAVKAPCNAG
ncbi:hypothetical protein [Streptomyces sp. NBC_01750]|uniref:hypothetical protein n=1 Tax=Streptomyces sp. NBC_01750 TaxID=2975928 RepID=UPI002DDBF0B6|nr:hypothetical protein [Streptomyces sp. NBC_01750]WSD38072.1 hypothetical protein OG966_27125 [Streptomyces sp. NBC_01750]